MAGLLSTITVASVGLTCKAALNCGLCAIQVNGLDILLDALENQERNHGQGIVTVSNHISTLDDPLTWGILPWRCYFSSRTTRWALGASDIIFTNRFFSNFFRLGQTLETFRGQGIYQESVDTAIQKLNEGAWVHLFGEGKINQPHSYAVDAHGLAHLPRFKWGVSRVISEPSRLPVVIPMWLTGYEKLMPEGRRFPFNYLPRPGAHLSVTFGDPIPPAQLSQVIHGSQECTTEKELARRRIRVASLVHSHVQRLGWSSTGKLSSIEQ